MQATIGRYRLGQEVARGGMGVVYRAEAPDGTPVALKLLLSGRGAAERQRQRLLREVHALLRLSHPNVVRILDAGEQDGVPYLALEWVEGEDLGTLLEREGPLDPRRAASLVAGVARALEHCHERSVLHRDLKPQNVLLRAADGQPLLTDFGLSRPQGAGLTGLTATGAVLGTPGYWPPEQAHGRLEEIDRRSDVWGLGALLFALLTGRPPAEGDSLLAAMAALERGPPPPSTLRPGIPAALDAVCARCLAPAREARYPDAGAVAAALEAWTGEGPAPGAPRRRARGLLLALVPLTLLVVATTTWLGSRPAEQRPVVHPVATPTPVAAPAGPIPTAATPGPAPGAGQPARPTVTLAPDADDPTLDALIRQGLAAHLAGDLPAGLAALDRAVAQAPGSVQARVGRGHLRYRSGDLAGAEADLDLALERDPTCLPALLNRGAVRGRRGRLDLARQDADRAVTLAPGNGEALVLRGVVRGQQGDQLGALRDCQEALRLDPGCADAHFHAGVFQEMTGDYAQARACYDAALRLNPAHPRALAGRAAVKAHQGDLAGARADYDRAIALDRSEPEPIYNRGYLRGQLSDPAGEEADYELALEVDPRYAPALTARGVLRSTRGDQEGALADLTRAVELAPDEAYPVYSLGVAQMEAGRHEPALRSFQRALELDPGQARAAFLAARMRDELGRREEAIAGYRAFLARWPGEPRLADRARARLAELER